MPVLVAAVAVVGVLCVFDLLLTFGVIRKLREYSTMLSELGQPESAVIGLMPGESPAPFKAITTGGAELSESSGLQVIAFFSSSCSICPRRVPPFSDYLTRHGIGSDSVLAIVECDDEPPPYVGDLGRVSQVCIEPGNSEVAKAFKVAGYPAFCVLDATGKVLASGYDPAALAEPARV